MGCAEPAPRGCCCGGRDFLVGRLSLSRPRVSSPADDRRARSLFDTSQKFIAFLALIPADQHDDVVRLIEQHDRHGGGGRAVERTGTPAVRALEQNGRSLWPVRFRSAARRPLKEMRAIQGAGQADRRHHRVIAKVEGRYRRRASRRVQRQRGCSTRDKRVDWSQAACAGLWRPTWAPKSWRADCP